MYSLRSSTVHWSSLFSTSTSTEPHLEMQGKKLKGEEILVKDKREKTAKGLRSFVIRWPNLKSPATRTRVSGDNFLFLV
jgi:hypothetical protein